MSIIYDKINRWNWLLMCKFCQKISVGGGAAYIVIFYPSHTNGFEELKISPEFLNNWNTYDLSDVLSHTIY